jgi:hypothetical protein
VLGALATVADGHPLLVTCDVATCAVAAGHHVALDESVELVHDVGCEIRDGGDGAALSLVTGVLITLP